MGRIHLFYEIILSILRILFILFVFLSAFQKDNP